MINEYDWYKNNKYSKKCYICAMWGQLIDIWFKGKDSKKIYKSFRFFPHSLVCIMSYMIARTSMNNIEQVSIAMERYIISNVLSVSFVMNSLYDSIVGA